jgi:uncharacterized membrane protein
MIKEVSYRSLLSVIVVFTQAYAITNKSIYLIVRKIEEDVP